MDSPASAPPSGRGRRWRDLCLNITASGGARVLAFVCTLAQVRVLVRALGETGYGVWATLLAVATVITFFDLGFGIGLETRLAEARAQGNEEKMRRTFSSGFLTLAALGLVFLVLGSVAAWTHDWAATWKLAGTPYASPARAALFIVVALFSLGVPFNAAPRLAGALQLGRLQAGWMAAGTGAALLVAYADVKLNGSWLALVTALSVIPLLQNAALLAQLWRRLGWPRTWPAPLPWAEWRPTLARSFLLAGPQLGLALMQAAPPIVLASVGGPLAATAFNLLQRLANPFFQALTLFLTPLWPTYVEARTRGDTSWLRRMLGLSLVAALAGAAAFTFVVRLRAVLLPWWLGSAVVPPEAGFAWLVAAWFGVMLCTQPLFYFLIGIERWRELSLLSVGGLGFALAGMWLGGRTTGTDGVLLGGLAGLGGVWLPGLIVATMRALRERPLPSAR